MNRAQCLICKIYLTYEDSEENVLLEHLNQFHYGVDFLNHVSQIREEGDKSHNTPNDSTSENIGSVINSSDCPCLKSKREADSCSCADRQSPSGSSLDSAATRNHKHRRCPPSAGFKSCNCRSNRTLDSKSGKNHTLKECLCSEEVRKNVDSALMLKTSMARIDLAPPSRKRKKSASAKSKNGQVPILPKTERGRPDAGNWVFTKEAQSLENYSTTSRSLLQSFEVERSSSNESNTETYTQKQQHSRRSLQEEIKAAVRRVSESQGVKSLERSNGSSKRRLVPKRRDEGLNVEKA